MANDQSHIVASIICVTYNHAPYIRQAVDSFLMQKTIFPYEIIIADDCSMDGTSAICAEYAAKYPDKIRHIRGEYNVGGVENERRAIEAAQGEYVALCEGDDYWIDSKKLQKQVEFLETHPDYSVTWTRYEKYLQTKDTYLPDRNEDLFKEEQESVEITTHMFLHRWITQYLTMVFRRSAYDNTWCEKYKYYRDSHQFYHLLHNGKGALLNFVGGVYRQTGDGMYSDLNLIHRQQVQIEVFKELWQANNDDDAKSMYELNTRYLLELLATNNYSKRMQLSYSWKLFVASGNIKEYLNNLWKMVR